MSNKKITIQLKDPNSPMTVNGTRLEGSKQHDTTYTKDVRLAVQLGIIKIVAVKTEVIKESIKKESKEKESK